jgi:hypothetical protein
MDDKHRRSPLRKVVKNGTVFGFDPVASARQGFDGDPYSAQTLECGHTII